MDANTLIEQLRRQNPSAQRLFWQRHWNDIYPICKKILGETADATDIASAVLSDFMMRHVQQIKHPEATTSYVRLIAIRRAVRLKERRGHESAKHERVDLAGVEDTDQPSAEDKALVSTLQPHVERCLGQLGNQAQQVLRLRFHNDMSNQRIAQLKGVSKQYIGRLVTKSLVAMRRCLQRKAVQGSGA